MGIAAEKLVDGRVKHLEMLQSIISRMAGQGAGLKNYCITLVTAICGVAISLKLPLSAFLALFPILVFWSLDAQYLRLERRFRALFDQVRLEGWETEPTFKIELGDAPRRSYLDAAFSWSLVTFYPALSLGVLAVAMILKWML
jgi:hypothetical protein